MANTHERSGKTEQGGDNIRGEFATPRPLFAVFSFRSWQPHEEGSATLAQSTLSTVPQLETYGAQRT